MRQRLTSAAWEFACEHGWQRLTLNAIAESAQCARSSIYRYFDNKEQLLGAVLQERVLSLGEELTAVFEQWDDPREKLLRGLYEFIKIVRVGPSLELMRTLFVDEERQMADIAMEYIPEMTSELLSIDPFYKSAREAGLFRDDVSDEDVLRWMVTVASAMVQQHTSDESAELEFLRKMLLPSIFKNAL